MHVNVQRIATTLAAAVLLCGTTFAVPAKASEAVSQNITVERVEGLSDDFMRGVDISALADIEANGGVYYDAQGRKADLFQILKASGVNWIRLRVWNNPTYAADLNDANGKVIAKKGQPYGGGNNNLATDLKLAKRAKDAGFKLLVDFHYSDSWADPAKQSMPQDWVGLNAKKLNAAVEKFTKDSINAFNDAGARPDAVQIGNELNNGFMWPLGKIWGEKGEKVGGFSGFTTLLKSAAKGVREAQVSGGKIKIIIHLADGGDNNLYRTMFDQITKAGVDYDIIGLSFYTYWHGGMADLKNNLEDLSQRYGKSLAVVETAYAFTEENADEQGNVFMVYSDKEHGYVPSVQGQATAVRDVIATVASVKGGCGVFYWEPAWLPVKGAGLSATEGNTWENQGMFDFKGRALPSLNVWGLVKGQNVLTQNAWGGSASNGSVFLPYAMADKLEITAKPGETPALPSKVKVVFSNDSEGLVDVTWNYHNWSAEKVGTVQLNGSIRGSTFRPVAYITLSNRVNILADSSFESGKLETWKLNGPGAACFMENNKGNARTGNWTYKSSSPCRYQMYIIVFAHCIYIFIHLKQYFMKLYNIPIR